MKGKPGATVSGVVRKTVDDPAFIKGNRTPAGRDRGSARSAVVEGEIRGLRRSERADERG
jgi:hypothetical protein